MEIVLKLFDEEYPVKGTKHDRKIVRAFLMNEEGLFCLHHLIRDDVFGYGDYYETPGGGVEEGESLEDALARECFEETGYEIRILDEIGIVDDYYNLINRHNLNHYYLCKISGGNGEPHFASYGDSFIESTSFLSLDEIIELYEKTSDKGVPGLVKRRELPLWKLLKRKLTQITLAKRSESD